MSLRPEVLLLIFGCMLVTIVPRVLPLLAANRLRLPPSVIAWLGYVPAAVISALFFNQILLPEGSLPTSWQDPDLLAGAAALSLAFATRSIGVTVVGGIGIYTVLSAFLPV